MAKTIGKLDPSRFNLQIFHLSPSGARLTERTRAGLRPLTPG
jgi:hypothetical protein